MNKIGKRPMSPRVTELRACYDSSLAKNAGLESIIITVQHSLTRHQDVTEDSPENDPLTQFFTEQSPAQLPFVTIQHGEKLPATIVSN